MMKKTDEEETKAGDSSSVTKTVQKRRIEGDREVIACIEFSDGNCLKQTIEYFKTTVTVPLCFYKDRMIIERGNLDSSIINKADFNNTQFIVDYYTNTDLFNDKYFKKVVKTKIEIVDDNGNVSYREEEKLVEDPRHLYIPSKEHFYTQCKSISKRDGFRITIYKISEEEIENALKIAKNRKIMSQWVPDSSMTTEKISSSSAPYGKMVIDSENISAFSDYNLKFVNPLETPPKQKIRLTELCGAFSSFVKHKYAFANLNVYPAGFMVSGDEGRSNQEFGWGDYSEDKVVKSKGKSKFVIKSNNAKPDVFCIPQELVKAFSKIATISGNNGVVAIYSTKDAIAFKIPISFCGNLVITIIPPPEEEEEEEEKSVDVPDFF